MKVALAMATILFSLASTSRAETLDIAVVCPNGGGPFIVALESSGDVWWKGGECSSPTWYYLTSIPGAYLICITGNLAYIATPTEMQVGFFSSGSEVYYQSLASFPIPPEIGTIADMDLWSGGSLPYVGTATNVNGDTWILKCDPNGWSDWSGPCTGPPDGPVNVENDSWGNVKERYR